MKVSLKDPSKITAYGNVFGPEGKKPEQYTRSTEVVLLAVASD